MVENRDRLGFEADVLRAGYSAGYFDKTDVERWAERQIAALDEPPVAMIELATIRRAHPLDVMNLLRLFSSGVPASESIETQIGFVGLAFDSGQLSLRSAKSVLWGLIHQDGVTTDQESEIYMLDDAYDLALCGTYGTMEDIEKSLCEFVMPYAEKLRQRCPELLDRVAPHG